MSATLSSSLTSVSVASMEVAAPVIVASPEVEKKGAKRARKEVAPAGAEASADPSSAATVSRSKKKAASPKPADSEAPAVESEGAAFEAGACEGEKKDSSGSLIVAKAIRVLLKSHSTPIHLGSDALPALNAKVTELIYEAIGRALANGRKTLKNSDF